MLFPLEVYYILTIFIPKHFKKYLHLTGNTKNKISKYRTCFLESCVLHIGAIISAFVGSLLAMASYVVSSPLQLVLVCSLGRGQRISAEHFGGEIS